MSIELGGVLGVEASSLGVRHGRIWNSQVDVPGGGDIAVRVTPFDSAQDVQPTGLALCAASMTFPAENAKRGGRGDSVTADPRTIGGPFGARTAKELELGPTQVPGAAAAGDIDGDGRIDAVVATRNSQAVVLYLQTAPGIYDRFPFFDARIGNPRGIALADLDGDDDLDIAVAGDGPRGTLSIFFQEPPLGGVPDFIQNRVVFVDETVLREPSGIVATDYDDDGDMDLLVSDASEESSAVILFAQGAAEGCTELSFGFSACDIGDVTSALGIAADDVDGNGTTDAVTSTPTGFAVYLQMAGGEHDVQNIVEPGVQLRSVATTDLDDDGDVDLVAGDTSSGRIVAARQDGPGNYDVSTLINSQTLVSPVQVIAADLDGANGSDFVAVDTGNGQSPDLAGLAICLDDGAGSYSCHVLRREAGAGGLQPTPRAAAVGDLRRRRTPRHRERRRGRR